MAVQTYKKKTNGAMYDCLSHQVWQSYKTSPQIFSQLSLIIMVNYPLNLAKYCRAINNQKETLHEFI